VVAWPPGAQQLGRLPDFSFEILPGAYFLPFGTAFAEFDETYAMRAELEEIYSERYRDCFRFLPDKSDGGYAFGRVDLEHLLRTSAGRIS
jgi:hypothetical protein